MTDCYVYDAVRTPRGKGKKDGALHEVTALELATQTLKAIRDRNNLDTSKVDDVVLGCVDPVGEQGRHRPHRGSERRLCADDRRCADQPLLRLRP